VFGHSEECSEKEEECIWAEREQCLLSSVGRMINAMTERDLACSRVKTIGDEKVERSELRLCKQ
jgi:hypothetical protein